MTFERARQPEQVAQRRTAILEATLHLFDTVGLDDARLVDIGERAGMSKASVYRYFESKEAIFLALLVRETEEWVGGLERDLASQDGAGTVDDVAALVAHSLADRPRLCSLAARVASVLERNISTDAIRAFKTENRALSVRLVSALHTSMPGISMEAAQQFVSIIITFQNGLFPASDPPPATRQVLADPEFASFCVDYRQSMLQTATLLLRALTTDR